MTLNCFLNSGIASSYLTKCWFNLLFKNTSFINSSNPKNSKGGKEKKTDPGRIIYVPLTQGKISRKW